MIAVSAVLLTACIPPAPAPAAAAPTAAAATIDSSTLRTLIASPIDTPELTVVGPAEPIADEQADAVSYTSGGLRITGVIRTPTDAGPSRPVVVVVHGSVNPETYESGGDLLPEQRALLDAGYVVFAPDLRGYAGSDAADTVDSPSVDPGFGWTTVLDTGMALDVVNALRVVRSGVVAATDPGRVGLLGHSLGGLLVLDAAVIAPGLSDMIVAMSALPSDFPEVFAAMSDEQLAELDEGWGANRSPSENPQYWIDISPRTFVDRATEPLLLIHGGDDDTALPQWSVQTAEAWRAAGHEARSLIIEGGDHHFSPHRDEADAAILAAFAAALAAGR